jgi:hypothetical protein
LLQIKAIDSHKRKCQDARLQPQSQLLLAQAFPWQRCKNFKLTPSSSLQSKPTLRYDTVVQKCWFLSNMRELQTWLQTSRQGLTQLRCTHYQKSLGMPQGLSPFRDVGHVIPATPNVSPPLKQPYRVA